LADGRLYNLDIREENFWFREARRKRLQRKAELLTCVRLAFSGGHDFGDEVERIQFQFDEMEMEELDEMGEGIKR